MQYIGEIIGAFFASYFFSVLFNTQKKELFYCGIMGASSWGLYTVGENLLKVQPEISSFIASLAVGILTCYLARLRKAPVTVFLVAGIIPIVPGAGMYRTMFALLNNDYTGTVTHLIETLQAAGAIAIALAFPLSIMIKRHRPRT